VNPTSLTIVTTPRNSLKYMPDSSSFFTSRVNYFPEATSLFTELIDNEHPSEDSLVSYFAQFVLRSVEKLLPLLEDIDCLPHGCRPLFHQSFPPPSGWSYS
jgi:hypothetical protein